MFQIQNAALKQFLRGLGAGAISFCTDMMALPGMPDDWGTALWVPANKAIVVMLGAWGINVATQQRRA